jgi:hypothetical protein
LPWEGERRLPAERDVMHKGVAMKATRLTLAALLVTAAVATMAHAQQPNPYFCPYIRQAPDACGPGYYSSNYWGGVYGPNYNVYPPFPPFNGLRPNMNNGAGNLNMHPFAHGPRDYFMRD